MWRSAAPCHPPRHVGCHLSVCVHDRLERGGSQVVWGLPQAPQGTVGTARRTEDTLAALAHPGKPLLCGFCTAQAGAAVHALLGNHSGGVSSAQHWSVDQNTLRLTGRAARPCWRARRDCGWRTAPRDCGGRRQALKGRHPRPRTASTGRSGFLFPTHVIWTCCGETYSVVRALGLEGSPGPSPERSRSTWMFRNDATNGNNVLRALGAGALSAPHEDAANAAAAHDAGSARPHPADWRCADSACNQRR